MIFAHVGPVPVEELLPAAGGAGTALLLARAWLAWHLRAASGRARARLPR